MFDAAKADRSWPPCLEVYCPACRRMVEAKVQGVAGGPLFPAQHYRFSMDSMDRQDIRLCRPGAFFLTRQFGPGQEDPQAAFRDTPRAWGWVNTVTSNTDAVMTVTANITRGDN